jgi:hypothetical protein
MNFKRFHALAVLAVTISFAGLAQAQNYANVMVGGAFAPGVYGQVSLGNNPPTPVWNAQPVIYGQPLHRARPMYLYVPQHEYNHWGRYCSRYQACGRPVHFVRGPGYYRQPESHAYSPRYERHSEYRRDHRDDRHDSARNPHYDNRRGER